MPVAIQMCLFRMFSKHPEDTSLWLLTLQSMPSLIMRTLLQVAMTVALN